MAELRLIAPIADPPWSGWIGVRNGKPDPSLVATLAKTDGQVDCSPWELRRSEYNDLLPLLWYELIHRWRVRNFALRRGSKGKVFDFPPYLRCYFTRVSKSTRQKRTVRTFRVFTHPIRINIPHRHSWLINTFDHASAEYAEYLLWRRTQGFGYKLFLLADGASPRSRRFRDAVDLFYAPGNEQFRSLESLARLVPYLGQAADQLLLGLRDRNVLTLKQALQILARRGVPAWDREPPAYDYYPRRLKRELPGYASYHFFRDMSRRADAAVLFP